MARSLFGRILGAALLTATCATGGVTYAGEDAHHPGAAAPPTAQAPAVTQPQTQGPPGMMMGMGGQQAMPGGMGMMHMNDQQGVQGGMGMTDMMRMMQMMRAMTQGNGPIEHVEGRIAFLRAELKITDAQAGLWNAFAEALRAQARAVNEDYDARRAAGGAPSFAQRLGGEERGLTARLAAVRGLRLALAPLEASFSEEQKRTAQLLLSDGIAMGMMPMH